MNTRQKIWELLTEGHSVDEIEQMLKDEPVKNIRVYIHRVKRDIKLGKKRDEGRKRVLRARGITETKIGEFYRNKQYNWAIDLTCSKCGKTYSITVSKEHMPLYTEEVKKNYLCLFCKPPKHRRRKCSASDVSPKQGK